MDILKNWKALTARLGGDARLSQHLFKIHMGAFDDLRRSGHLIEVDGRPASELAVSLSPEERLALAVKIGSGLVRQETYEREIAFMIDRAYAFPNCVFIVVAAALEEVSASFGGKTPEKRMHVICQYEFNETFNDPFEKNADILEPCFPWIQLTQAATYVKKDQPVPEVRRLSLEKSSLLFNATSAARVDVQRVALGGHVYKGTISANDVVNIVDGSGRVLCREGIIMAIFVDGKRVESALAGQDIDEMLIAMDLPSGDYDGINLIDGPRRSAPKPAPAPKPEPAPEPEKKRGFFARLFGKK